MFKIGNREITKESPPFIIAEAGINHNGEIEKAFEMIQVAKASGADAIKFQTFKATEFISDSNQTYTYQSQGKTATESMLELFQRCEFIEDEWLKIKQKCDENRILFLSTPQNKSDLDLLLKLDIQAIKIGSDDFTNIPLIKEYTKSNLPIILSCGMADMIEVKESLNAIGIADGYPVALLLCTSEYPTPPQDVNILKLKTLRNEFNNLILGFSDHTQGLLASSLALALGAVIFEKHFTLDNNLHGPDHWFSENVESLKNWVESIHTSYKMMGSPAIKPTKAEEEMRVLARRSVVAINDISVGELFTENNIGLQRPGNGVPPIMYPKFIGKKSKNKINKGFLLTLNDIE